MATNFLIDPGPGSIVCCSASHPKGKMVSRLGIEVEAAYDGMSLKV